MLTSQTAVKGDTRRTMMFDTGPEEDAWERNVHRLRPDLSAIELIQLSHWHRDHSGGMLRAIKMIKEKRKDPLIVDLHPNRPDYRGFMAMQPISLEADPTFTEIEQAGAVVKKNDQPHMVLDGMFLVSGEIPRVTLYEKGLQRGVRFNASTGTWESDELILDERFLMCNVKAKRAIWEG
jgi:7,8-dihydropterin-6-yl-methyl-4-(beta-D-ribofuranosyl)aminobenzene 5'-phosphate synthase